jgi:3-oxoacyl-[acyl-carrier-protein] synthase II
MESKRVVVTGLGALTPIGNTVEEFWNGLANGVSGADLITRFDATNFKTKFACEVKNFEVTDFIPRQDARKMDLFTQFGVVIADQAIADAGLNEADINKD